MSEIHITVIVPTYNRDQYLRNLLRQLASSNYPSFDILVIDQTAVHDSATASLLASLKGRLKVIRQPPQGLIQAMRLGIREASGDVIVFLDDDVDICGDLLERHAANYSDLTIGAVGGMVLAPGAVPSERLHWMFRLRPSLGPYFFTHAYGRRIDVAVMPGCNMSFRRVAVAQVGSVDPLIHTHHSEIDLCRKFIAAGWRVVHDPTARVVHWIAPGGTRTQRGVAPAIFADSLYVFRKYHRGLDLWLLRAQLFWHRIIRTGLREPGLAPLHLRRYVAGYRLARRRLGPVAASPAARSDE